ncbi:hypothetical protein HY312_03435 [Candidatus Saccharibacteria bacterium]|nr:hypothetical protein [Candidatus Saccharibacteria bacterium]
MATGTKTPNSTEEQDEAHNPGDDYYNAQFNQMARREEIANLEANLATPAYGGKTGKHIDGKGDLVDDNYNSERANTNRDDVNDQERRGVKTPRNSGTEEGGKPNSIIDLGKKSIEKKFGIKMKPTYTVAMLLIMLSFFVVTLGSGASLIVALEKGMTNDGSDDATANIIMHRAFQSLLGSADCKGKKLVCKVKSATKAQVAKFKEGKMKVNGDIVDDKGNKTKTGQVDIDPEKLQAGERVSIKSVDLVDGQRVDSSAKYLSATEKNVNLRSWSTRAFNPRSASFFGKSFTTMLTDKVKVSKGRATDEEKKTGSEKKETRVKKRIEEAYSKVANNPRAAASNAIKAAANPARAFDAVTYACLAYNVTRIAVGTVKLDWAYDLMRFSWPFLRLASKAADGSLNTEEDFKDVEKRMNQLVYYVSPEYAEKLTKKVNEGSLTDADKKSLSELGIEDPDEDKAVTVETINSMVDKNATDAQGLKMAIYGDLTKLTEITNAYSLTKVGSVMTAEKIIGQIQNVFGSKQAVKTACVLANTLGNGMAATQLASCFTGVGSVKCIGSAIVGAVGAYAKLQLYKQILTVAILAALKYGTINYDLKGIAAGSALASGISLILARKARSSGLQPAVSAADVKSYIASTSDLNYKYGEEIAINEAKSEPFNIYNSYSFAGRLNATLNPYATASSQKTGFGYIANIFGVLGNALSGTAKAAQNSPSLMTNTDENLKHRLNVLGDGTTECRDEETQDAGLVCDYSGRTVSILSPTVIQWAKDTADNKHDYITDNIEYMQAAQNKDEAAGGTRDATCDTVQQISAIINDPTAVFGNDSTCKYSKEASIDEDGKINEKSQFALFVKYCTGERELEMGSTDVDTDYGSEKDQDWHTGKQCGKRSNMMDNFSFYYNICYVQYATSNDASSCADDAPATEEAPLPSGPAGEGCGGALSNDVKELANKILTCANIKFQTASGKAAMEYIAQTGRARECGAPAMGATILKYILIGATQYKLTVGVLVDDHGCDGGFHPKGMAVDINGVKPASTDFQQRLDWTADDQKNVAEFMKFMDSKVGAIGFGQVGCFQSTPAPTLSGKALLFADGCNHLHMDTRGS